MSLKKEYRCGSGKLKYGPGGLGCPCCNPYHCHPRNMKHLLKRAKRRAANQVDFGIED